MAGYAKAKPKTNQDIDREMQAMLEDEDMKAEIEQHRLRQKGHAEELGRPV